MSNIIHLNKHIDWTVVDGLKRLKYYSGTEVENSKHRRDNKAMSDKTCTTDLLHYYTDENGTNGQTVQGENCLKFWNRMPRQSSSNLTETMTTVTTNSEIRNTKPEWQKLITDFDEQNVRVQMTASDQRKTCRINSDSHTTYNSEDNMVKSCVGSLMANKPCDCDKPESCLFYSNVKSMLIAEVHSAFMYHGEKTRPVVIGVSQRNDKQTNPDKKLKNKKKSGFLLKLFHWSKKDHKMDDQKNNISANSAVNNKNYKQKSSKDVKYIQFAFNPSKRTN